MPRKPVGATRTGPLAEKIARLVRERGWTIQQFAAASRLNRHTARKIIEDQPKWLRGDTLKACAQALGCSVDELTHLSAEALLRRAAQADAPGAAPSPDALRAEQPALADWLEAHPHHGLSAAQLAELASIQGVGGPLTAEGVAHFVDRVRRKEKLLRQVEILAGTAYLPLLEQLAELMLAKLDPLAHRPRS